MHIIVAVQDNLPIHWKNLRMKNRYISTCSRFKFLSRVELALAIPQPNLYHSLLVSQSLPYLVSCVYTNFFPCLNPACCHFRVPASAVFVYGVLCVFGTMPQFVTFLIYYFPLSSIPCCGKGRIQLCLKMYYDFLKTK